MDSISISQVEIFLHQSHRKEGRHVVNKVKAVVTERKKSGLLIVERSLEGG